MQFVANWIGSERLLIIAIILFAFTYIGMIVFQKLRPYIALGSAVIFVLLGALPINSVPGAVDWNVIFMIAGTMGTVALFIESKMPAKLADMLIDKSPNLKWAVIWLSIFAGVVSAFIDNVATVLMIAPVAINIAKKLKISPVPSVIVISIASNLQGAATLVGDTTSILLGGAAKMNFLDFFFFKPNGYAHMGVGMFWIVQISFLAATAILFFIFRKSKQAIQLEEKTVVNDLMPTFLLLFTVGSLIAVSFIPKTLQIGTFSFTKPAAINGILCVLIYLVGIVHYAFVKKDKSVLLRSLKEIDYRTLLLLAGLFVVIAGLTNVGVLDKIKDIFQTFGGGVFVIYSILVWFSVLVSAFVDNIPYVATMLPVVTALAEGMGVTPYLFYFGLLSGATLGGNLTPIGASANIAGLGILRKEGHSVKTSTFMKLSVPYTLSAVAVGYVLVWIFWR
ncbi:MAG: arsenic transporter [Oscillospiraceae bacterium]|nr:arsenic transporter [Oscillospiraceae bacterium]